MACRPCTVGSASLQETAGDELTLTGTSEGSLEDSPASLLRASASAALALLFLLPTGASLLSGRSLHWLFLLASALNAPCCTIQVDTRCWLSPGHRSI